jgi:signal transduction histidine kinase
MATPHLQLQPTESIKRGSPKASGISVALRLLEAERWEKVYPILLKEIIGLGYQRAFVAAVDFETREIIPSVSLNCSRNYLDRFRTSLDVFDGGLADIVQSQKPAVVQNFSMYNRPLYCHPVVFSSPKACWEEHRERRRDCLAADNARHRRTLSPERQVCGVCNIRGYAAVIAVELPRRDADPTPLSDLIELANQCLGRLLKLEHRYNRIAEMDITIAQLQTVMQSMTDPVILTDNHYRVIVQNKAAERFFKSSEHATKGFLRAVELNNLLLSAALSSVAVSGRGDALDVTLVDAIEGEEMLFEAVCAPTYGRNGTPLGMVTVMHDVTEMRRADQELRGNYDRLRQAEEKVRQDRDHLNVIIENVGDPIVVCDSAAKIVLLDPLAQNLFGAQTDLARNPANFRNLAQLDAHVTAFRFSFASSESGPMRLVDSETGKEVEYHARSGKIYDQQGQVAFTVTVLRDLSAVRKVEQMRIERRMLEIEKFAAAGRLAATIAHEVNNPMEAIKNAIYLLSDAVRPESQPVYDILKSETERVARIVRQMLGLYRNNEQIKPININTLVEDTILLLNRQLQRSNVEIDTRLEEMPDALVAADQLRQVLSNLVINAKDAMPNGGRLIIRSSHVRRNEGAHGWIRVTIADTGHGISRSMLDTVFEPFVTTKGEKGTGLGLWIVRGIVNNHGGKISVRSRAGKGTVFKIEFPVVR